MARLLVGLLMLFIATALPAAAAKRVALVIGNAEYQFVTPLTNPLNDAALMETALKNAGFEVIRKNNLDQQGMKLALIEFSRKLKQGAEAGMLYYAGHGIEVDGKNYLVPIDSNMQSKEEADVYNFDVNSFLSMMENSGVPFNIMVLDACRNNPFRGLRTTGGGLAPMRAPVGSYVAYATAPGSVAADGDGKNSPFTEALAANMAVPGLALEEVFKQTRTKVRAATGGAQVPFDSSAIEGNFYFTAPGPVIPQPALPLADRNAEAKLAFDAAGSDINMLKTVASEFADTTWGKLAAGRVKTLEENKVAVLVPQTAEPVPEPEPAPEVTKDFRGISVRLLTRPGPVIAGRLAERGKEFEKATGAKVTVSELPFAELFPKIETDWKSASSQFDAAVVPVAWSVDFERAGVLEDLEPFLAKDSLIDLADITPFYRNFAQKVGGKTKLLMVDGDFQMVYYRKDILEQAGLQPPRTWDEYLDVASKIHGQDMNGDNIPDYGSCIFKKKASQSYFAIQSIVAPFVQTEGTAQGFHFDRKTLKPLVNNAGWRRAFEIYKETGNYGPPNERELDIGDTRGLVVAGRCGLFIEWGDPVMMSIENNASAIAGKIYSIAAIGTREVLDRKSGKLVRVNLTNSPYSIEGVNYAPFAAFGGWAGAVNAKASPKTKEAAYAFLSYMNQAQQSKLDVATGWTGYNPYRQSHLDDLTAWTNAGVPADVARSYVSAILTALNSPNMASDLKIPGANAYTSVVLDRELARFLSGEIDVDQALENIENGWEQITNDFGRKDQNDALILSLGRH